MIDWEGTRLAYNRDNGTSYKTRKEFLTELYKKMPSTHKITNVIYVSAMAILKALRRDGIKIGERGHRYPSPGVKKILAIDTKNKTRAEIAKITGLTNQYCWILLRDLKLPWRKRHNRYS